MKNIAFPARNQIRKKLENFSCDGYFEIFTSHKIDSKYAQFLESVDFYGAVMNHYILSTSSPDVEYVLEKSGVSEFVSKRLINQVDSVKIRTDFRMPAVMAVANATPDSFYPGSRLDDSNNLLDKLMDAKPDIIDVGGESTRPGSGEVSIEEEIGRIKPVIEYIQSGSEIPISLDTRHPEVLDRFADKVEFANDISGFRDQKMVEIASNHSLKCITMHMRGVPSNMQSMTDYVDVVPELISYLQQSAEFLQESGIPQNHIYIDPGIGFSKDFTGNLKILSDIDSFSIGYMTLVGASRKSFIGKISGEETTGRLPGTLAVTAFLSSHAVDIIRVHDPVENIQLLKVLKAITEGKR